MNHTPGPWVWGDIKDGSAGERSPDGIPYLARTGTAVDLTLYGEGDALGNLPILSIDVRSPSSFPKPADAYLIAAAPDLLEALKRLLLYPEILLQRGWNGNATDDLTLAKAAIAKAEGK